MNDIIDIFINKIRKSLELCNHHLNKYIKKSIIINFLKYKVY